MTDRALATAVMSGIGLAAMGAVIWIAARRARRLGPPLLLLRRRPGIEAYMGVALAALGTVALGFSLWTRTTTPMLPVAFLLALANLLRGTALLGFWERGFGTRYQLLPWERLHGWRWKGDVLHLDVSGHPASRFADPAWRLRLQPGQREAVDALLRARGIEPARD